MDDEDRRLQELRRMNIEKLIAEEHADDKAALAAKLGVTLDSLATILGRKLTDKRMRALEALYHKPRHWFDQDHNAPPARATPAPAPLLNDSTVPPLPKPARASPIPPEDTLSADLKKSVLRVIEEAIDRMTTRQALELLEDALGRTRRISEDDINEILRRRSTRKP